MISMIGCTEDKLAPLYSEGDSPGNVTVQNVESLPGAVKITYSLPADRDLLYVLAEYTDKYGRTIQGKSSTYTNTLTIDGFADTASYELSLYAVSRTEVRSTATSIQVKSLLPPVYQARNTVALRSDFGGVNVSFNNEAESPLALVVSYKDSLGRYVDTETFYTSTKEVSFTARGFASKETEFAVYLRDRWNNRTDTIFEKLVPIFEKELDKSRFRAVSLPTDVAVGWGLPIPNLWDNTITEEGYMWHSTDAPMPMHITFDLGVEAKLSRFVLWQRQGQWIYNHGNPKRYEVWGSVDPPNNGSWDNWTLLASCVSEKPSKQPLGSNTSEDVAAAARGEESNISLDAPRVRYIRLKILEPWVGKGGLASHVSEMTFFGNDN
ncbi:DUF5000 domain-containing lipoprotein [Sphingobacterium populi]|uniref:DUF5000 domain-containing lipoprotein n=2 Tax=Sphingobacteriaceae TaxID=84566 RepID=A0ABW5UE77_9SPHI